ncbi:tetratricopeptide repeat-containing sulfotransferase family protein [Luteimonas saliphila]|uniref:tetratricopeptide repeat-containing sulfotransferase family protein n=1 Tax=Luteimonas saliphila TaxID=2804919 RepID=UPI001EE160EF|nr:tetratricopeptide repeat-containing sulfotransferase family protein [Luteimonas saliphila]
MSSLAQKVGLGYELLRQSRFTEALELSREVAGAYPANPHALSFAAEASLANGNAESALEWIDQAIASSGDDPSLKLKKANLLSQLRRRPEVQALAAEITAAAENNGPLLQQVGHLYHRINMQPEAVAQFERAHALVGDSPELLYRMAVARFFSGDFEQAERDLDRLLTIAPQSGPALYLRATLRRQTPEHNHIEDIERRLKAGIGKLEHESSALYALAKELEDLGEYDRSFAALAAGAVKKRSLMKYDVQSEIASLRAIRDAYTSGAMDTPAPGHDEEGAIFIVGMPRTGTTLAERLLVQSGKVAAAGELLDFGNLLAASTQKVIDADPAQSQASASLQIDFAQLGRNYMCNARQAAEGSPWFIDKLPVNYLYCGMIRKALPKARIIHLVRDPLDSCYAVFKTLFFNSYSFSYDLDDLAEYYIAYRQMMRHWHTVMPGAILDVRYEDLVTDTETQARRIYEWCDLPWDPAVLDAPMDHKVFSTASAAQVREPVHSRSVNSSRRYAVHLAPLAAKLAAAGVIDA